jgi:hypothetical protein
MIILSAMRLKPQANSSAVRLIHFDDKTKASAAGTLNNTIATKTILKPT